MLILATPKAWIKNDRSVEFTFARDETVKFKCLSQTHPYPYSIQMSIIIQDDFGNNETLPVDESWIKETEITRNDVDFHYQLVEIINIQSKIAGITYIILLMRFSSL